MKQKNYCFFCGQAFCQDFSFLRFPKDEKQTYKLNCLKFTVFAHSKPSTKHCGVQYTDRVVVREKIRSHQQFGLLGIDEEVSKLQEKRKTGKQLFSEKQTTGFG